ncbi:lipopolysaccharide A protein [Cellulophaga baltica]|nr:lipopolysaccharide A protein [Cellulophaga baltica]
MNIIYYIKRFSRNALPDFYFKNFYNKIRTYEKICDANEVKERLAYYVKFNDNFEVPEQAVAVKDFKNTKGTFYYLDLKEFLHYFNSNVKFAYHFGDETHINPYPTLFKARPIHGAIANSVLFKLNKRRHFKWVKDSLKFSEKEDMLVWRGQARKPLRVNFVKNFYNHPLCNIGQIKKEHDNEPWIKEFMTINEQLAYKFIYCPEGYDVATNLKWAMSSNSLCIMPKPKYETWFMEGTLKAGVHYVEVKDDCSDLEEKINYYSKNIKESEEIINNAHQHIKRFQDKKLEDLLCLKVLEKYAALSNQKNALKF